MKKSPKKPVVPALTRDPRVVAVIRATRDGFELTSLRTSDGAVSMLAAQHFGTDDERVSKWIETQRAARAIVALPGADVIVRAVQLPPADEARLEGALQLNASAFVQGRTSDWRVASALLPRERGEGIRTGLVAEWPEDANRADMPIGLSEGPMVSFAPAIAGLAAIASVTDAPLLWVDSANGVLSVCVPTTRGLLARVIRAGGNGEDIEIAEVAQAVGEACVHAGVPGAEIPNTIERTVQAARGALSGGFGCADADLEKLSALVRDCDEASDPQWWRTHGLAVGIALAASGPAMPLTRLQWTDLSARPDRVGALINRISEPRTARRIMLVGILTIALAPLAVEGARLLLLRWKLPDLEGYVKAEELDRKKQAMYRVLGRQGASMTKTLSDIACSAPDGIEVEFINVAQSAKGQAVTVRGKARAAGGLQGTEIMLQMEKQLRESGAFEQVLRNSEAPDTRGYQEFAINATAVRPTYTVAFPEAQDFARTSMRVRRYGPPPDDVDAVASGLDTRNTPAPSSASRSTGASDVTSDAASTVAPRSGSTVAAASGDEPTDGEATASKESGRQARGSGRGKSSAGTTSTPSGTTSRGASATDSAGEAAANTEPADTATADAGSTAAAGADSKSAARGARAAGSATRGGLATRGNLGGSSEVEPPPPVLSENEIKRMSREEAREALVKVSRARQRADLDDAVKTRLKTEFDLLLERCKHE
ncbi:MAG: hypothetical protein DWH89_00730 [Planctomycetota bacterium]|nr:MAG: hypothetical protein DWH89_00730 [Planctomycetota bacterium]